MNLDGSLKIALIVAGVNEPPLCEKPPKKLIHCEVEPVKVPALNENDVTPNDTIGD
jgi:hypothetical protein